MTDNAAVERPQYGAITRAQVDALAGEITFLRAYASSLETYATALEAKLAERDEE